MMLGKKLKYITSSPTQKPCTCSIFEIAFLTFSFVFARNSNDQSSHAKSLKMWSLVKKTIAC
jgi:hypothetical protein